MFVMENWGWPQWTMIIILLLSLSFGIGSHGEKNINRASSGFLSIGLFVAYTSTQTEPFSSEHTVIRYVVLVGLYVIWHTYVDLVREDKL